MDILGCPLLNTGLNNQRICLYGFLWEAINNHALINFPNELLDYFPRQQKRKVPDTIDTVRVFDEFNLKRLLSTLQTTDKPPTRILTQQEYFKLGGRALGHRSRNERHRSFSTEFLHATLPSAEVDVVANEICDFLNERGAVPLQLRIERDWQNYLLRKIGALEFKDDNEHITVDVDTILKKIRNTSFFDKYRAIWACCDEDDLVDSKEDLKSIANSNGFELLFKSDLPEAIVIPTPLLMRACVDFSVSLKADAYIGLQKSTFSNILSMYAEIGDTSEKQYIFDNPSDELALRTLQ